MRLSSIFKLHIGRFFSEVLKTQKAARNGMPVAYVSFRGEEVKRPLNLVVTLLRMSGFRVFVNIHVKDFLRAGEYGIKMFDDAEVFYSPFGIVNSDLFLFNRDTDDRPRKSIHINFDVFGEGASASEADLFFPIMFHPNFLTETVLHDIGSCTLNTDRKIRVFFAGNIDEATYNKKRTADVFKIHTRYEIIQFVREHFSADELYEPKSLSDLKEGIAASAFSQKIVLCDTERFKIPQDEWFEILSKADFFLSPPGVLQPYCHNTVEAMAVGTIPILQYPNIYKPALQDRFNAVVFSDLPDLERQLKNLLLRKDDGKENTMHEQAKLYYERYLSPSAFKNQLIKFLEGPRKQTELYVCQNALSVLLFEQYRERITDR